MKRKRRKHCHLCLQSHCFISCCLKSYCFKIFRSSSFLLYVFNHLCRIIRRFTSVITKLMRWYGVILPSNLDNNCTSDTSGGSDAILSLTASSLDALASNSNSAWNIYSFMLEILLIKTSA